MENKIYQVRTNLCLDIIEIEYETKTNNFYKTKNSRFKEALNTNYIKSFDTKKEAINYLEYLLTSKINSVESTLEYYKLELSKFEKLYKI